jgi:hypothetical protein
MLNQGRLADRLHRRKLVSIAPQPTLRTFQGRSDYGKSIVQRVGFSSVRSVVCMAMKPATPVRRIFMCGFLS